MSRTLSAAGQRGGGGGAQGRRTGAVFGRVVQRCVAHAVAGGVDEGGDGVFGLQVGEQVVEELFVVAARGFHKEFFRGGALRVQSAGMQRDGDVEACGSPHLPWLRTVVGGAGRATGAGALGEWRGSRGLWVCGRGFDGII